MENYWIKTYDMEAPWKCSACRRKSRYDTQICTHCGAKMENGMPLPNCVPLFIDLILKDEARYKDYLRSRGIINE